MTVYVDELHEWGTIVGYRGPAAEQAERVGAKHGHMWCHLFADEKAPDELHVLAKSIGMRREWFQGDHYDLVPPRRAAAVRAGAVEVSDEEAVKIWDIQRPVPVSAQWPPNFLLNTPVIWECSKHGKGAGDRCPFCAIAPEVEFYDLPDGVFKTNEMKDFWAWQSDGHKFSNRPTILTPHYCYWHERACDVPCPLEHPWPPDPT